MTVSFFRKPFSWVDWLKVESLSSSGIYQRVRNETEEVLKIFDESLGSSDEALYKAIESARESFEKEKEKCDATLAELDSAAEWSELTIAFYGETNAGKSTIIETLRILMGERTKKEEQRCFIEARDRLGLNEDGIRKWEEKKKALFAKEEELSGLDEKNKAVRQNREFENKRLQKEIKEIEENIAAYPFWRRAISFLWKIPEKEKLKALLAGLESFEAETARMISEQDSYKAGLVSEIMREKKSIETLSEAAEELSLLEDGRIIGDGRSDFTRDTRRYEFGLNDRKFVLLDVPGIEGKEEEVNREIMEAVRKAHIVFYVTSEPKPPEKGDKNKGTIEKIKEHLGAQTEVYAIYNKRITNPAQLDGVLVNDGEKAALDVLESVLKEQLGSNYQGRVDVSAGPAFFVATDCFALGGRRFKQRAKFVEKMGGEQVAAKTGMRGLVTKIKEEILLDVQKKILRSNFNKANDAVSVFKSGIDMQVDEVFKPLHLSLIDRSEEAISQIKSAVESFCKAVNKNVSEIVEKKWRETRRGIHKSIDSDISNDVLKFKLESALEMAVESIGPDLLKEIGSRKKELEEKIGRISAQYVEHVGDVIADFNFKYENGFNLNLNVDSGVDYWAITGIFGSAVGLIVASGGLAIGVAIAGIVVSFAKVVWSLFSSSQKMAHQKNEVDKHIDAAFGKVLKDLKEKMVSISEQARGVALRIENAYLIPVGQLEKITSLLRESSNRLQTISMDIRFKGGL